MSEIIEVMNEFERGKEIEFNIEDFPEGITEHFQPIGNNKAKIRNFDGKGNVIREYIIDFTKMEIMKEFNNGKN